MWLGKLSLKGKAKNLCQPHKQGVLGHQASELDFFGSQIHVFEGKKTGAYLLHCVEVEGYLKVLGNSTWKSAEGHKLGGRQARAHPKWNTTLFPFLIH